MIEVSVRVKLSRRSCDRFFDTQLCRDSSKKEIHVNSIFITNGVF